MQSFFVVSQKKSLIMEWSNEIEARRIEGARETNGGSGGPPPDFFLKKTGKWCKSRPPWLFFQQIIVYEINTILYSYWRTKNKRSLLKKEKGIAVTGVLLCLKMKHFAQGYQRYGVLDPSCTFRFAKLVYNQM